MLSPSQLHFVPDTHNYAKALQGTVCFLCANVKDTQGWKTHYPPMFKTYNKVKPHHTGTHVSQSLGIYASPVLIWVLLEYDTTAGCTAHPLLSSEWASEKQHSHTHKVQSEVIKLECLRCEVKIYWETSSTDFFLFLTRCILAVCAHILVYWLNTILYNKNGRSFQH